MKLSYRGISYESKPVTLEINEGEIGGKYRGQDWRYHYPRHIPQIQPKSYLQYRGVAYSTQPPAKSDNSSPQSDLMAKFCPVTSKKLTEVFVDETAKTHLENMRRNLEHRLQVAKEKGDENLVNLLEKESKQLILNG